MDTMPPNREAIRPARPCTPLFAHGLGLGVLLAALTACGEPAPHGRADTPVQHPQPILPADHQSPVAPTNGASDATRLAAPPAPDEPTSSARTSAKALPPLPGSSGGDIIAVPSTTGPAAAAPTTPRPAPPAATAPSDANRLPGPADPDARAPGAAATEPGTTHGLIIPGPADRADGTPPAPTAPHAQPAPAPAIGSPVNPPPSTSGGGDPGAAGTAAP